MSPQTSTANRSQEVTDIRYKFRAKLQQELQRLAHLDQTENCPSYSTWILRAGGGFGDVYEAYLSINGRKVKVALKQMRSYLLTNGEFAKVG